MGGFFESNPNLDFSDSQTELFLGTNLKKVFLTSGFLSENETCRLFTFVDYF